MYLPYKYTSHIFNYREHNSPRTSAGEIHQVLPTLLPTKTECDRDNIIDNGDNDGICHLHKNRQGFLLSIIYSLNENRLEKITMKTKT